MKQSTRPRLAVWKFASCDGCQLTLLDCEEHLLELCDIVEIAHFPEASSTITPGRYDISLIEGSLSSKEDESLARRIRRSSRVVVTLGACANAGGIQALRNGRDQAALVDRVYPHPDWLRPPSPSIQIARAIGVDYELRGCPISKSQLLDLLTALLNGRRPDLPTHSVCEECKRSGIPCLMVSRGIPCMGPVTQTGCGALCPDVGRGCYGCFGPSESPNIKALKAEFQRLGVSTAQQRRLFHFINCYEVGPEAEGNGA